jgi:hypothetical protein
MHLSQHMGRVTNAQSSEMPEMVRMHELSDLCWKSSEYEKIGSTTHAFYAPSIQISLKLGFHKTPDLTVERLKREVTFSWILPPACRCGADIKLAAAVKLSKSEAYGCCTNCHSQYRQPGDEHCESAETVRLERSSA